MLISDGLIDESSFSIIDKKILVLQIFCHKKVNVKLYNVVMNTKFICNKIPKGFVLRS